MPSSDHGEEFCAGYRDEHPANDRPCPMPRQPLKMTGEPRMLLGAVVGFRCRECRYVFCAACAWTHFGLGRRDRALSDWTRVEMEESIRVGRFDALVLARAQMLQEAMPYPV